MVEVSSRSGSSRRDWSNAPQLPQPSRKQEDYYREPRSAALPDRHSQTSVSSSDSSRASSVFTRRGYQAYESSTSVDESSSKSSRRDWGLSQRRQRPSALSADLTPYDGNASHARRSDSRRDPMDVLEDDRLADTSVNEGYGGYLWNRVASAANTLTINVGKAWASGLFTEDGPVTPEGGESRLTKALKSYHLSKARTASDLPSWLFTEEERRVTRSSFSAREEDRSAEVRPPRQRGLKAIYANADEEASPPARAPASSYLRERTSQSRFDDPEERYSPPATHQSKATSRLQAMRDARRPNAKVQQSPMQHEVGRNDDNWDSGMHGSSQELPLRRVGLPSGPRRR